MKFYLLFIGLLITFCSYGEMPQFDWEFLSSDANLQEKYSHVLGVDRKAIELIGTEEGGRDNPYTMFYGVAIDLGRNIEKMNLLKSIVTNFQDKDPQAKVILGLLYYNQESYKIEEVVIKESGNHSVSSLKKVIEAVREWKRSESYKKALVLFSEACDKHYFIGCNYTYTLKVGEAFDCMQFGAKPLPNCDDFFRSVAIYEAKLLKEALDHYDRENDENMKKNIALLIYSIYKQGPFTLAPKMQDFQKYGFPRNSNQAEILKQRAESIFQQEKLEGL